MVMGSQEKLVWQCERWDFAAIALVLFLVLQYRYISELEIRTLGIAFLALLLSYPMTFEVVSQYLSFSSVKRR